MAIDSRHDTVLSHGSDPNPPGRLKGIGWTILLLLVGAFLMLAAEPMREHLAGRMAADDPVKRTVENRRLEWLSYTIEHFGSVLLVAMLIRIGIEEAAQRRAFRELSSEFSAAVKSKVDDAFVVVDQKVELFTKTISSVQSELSTIEYVIGGTLYAGRLDSKTKAEIAEIFLNPPFFRPSYLLEITITPTDAGFVKVSIETDALLQNISAIPQPFRVKAFLDNVLQTQGSQFTEVAQFHRFEFGPDTPEGRQRARLLHFDLHSLDKELLAKQGILRWDRDVLAFDYTSGDDVQPGQTYFSKMWATQQMRDSDLFPWIMQTATNRLEIKVHLDGSLNRENFAVVVKPLHHREHALFDPTISEDGKQLSWCIDSILLPFQGVQIWWSRKDRKGAVIP